MKKIFFVIMMAVSCMTASAHEEAGTFSIRPRIGATLSNLTDLEYKKPFWGYIIGADAMYQINDWFGAAAGLRYGRYGGRQQYDTDKINYRLDYVSVPVLASFYPVKGLALKTGVDVAFNTRAKIWTALSGQSYWDSRFVEEWNKAKDASGDVDCKDYTNTVMLSIPVGISYEISHFIIDLRYNIGLTKVFNNDDTKMNSFVLTVGFSFGND